MNKSVIMGRFVADPEIKTTKNGNKFTSFTLAVKRSYKSNDGVETDWVDFIAWNRTAEFISKFFVKGKLILIEGSLSTRLYEYEGNKRKAVEVVVEKAFFTGDK